MLTPELPANENTRIKTLQNLNVLDTPPEERLDRITNIAANMFDVPIALVSLVDTNRQWFKSCVGLDATETARDVSFCGHAILDDQAFVINDTCQDERFRDNPLVVGEPKIRFYAGIPLGHDNGSKLGTLCLIDMKPRSFEQEDVDLLKELALLVELELVHKNSDTTDTETGLSNRKGFNALSKISLKVCQKMNLTVSVAFLFVKGLLSYRQELDKYNATLRLVSREFKSSLRGSDLVARYDDSGFVALLSNSDKATSLALLDNALTNVNTKLEAFADEGPLELVVGVIDSSPYNNIDELIFNAFLQLHT